MKCARLALSYLLILFAGFGAPAVAEGKVRDCLDPDETREVIAANGLIRPIVALRSAAQQFGAEALGAKLCRWGADFVYEIALLRADGRVVHAFVNASNGDSIGSR